MTKENFDYRFQPNFSFSKQHNTVRDLQKEHAKFLWYQLLTFTIENMTNDQTAVDDMVTYAYLQYKDNHSMQQEIKKFSAELTDPDNKFDALHWYTKNTFVSKMVNNALKSEDYVVLHKLRAFLKCLIDAIKNESHLTKEYWDDKHLLYSGRELTEDDIEILKSQQGEVIAVNGFLSTSFSMTVANCFHSNTYFRIRIPFNLETIHFASIAHRSANRDENEVLFSLNSTFLVDQITYDRLSDDIMGWIIDLTATDRGSDIFQAYLSWAKKHHDMSNTLMFSHLLIQMGEYASALMYLDEYCQNEDQIKLLINKACAHLRREGPKDFENAETYFYDALHILDNKSERIIDRVCVLSNLGALYDRQDKYDCALEKFKEAKQYVQDDPEILAIIHNNIGVLYDQGLENHVEAVTYYELALDYYRQNPTHHAYAQTLQNLACAIDTCGQHKRARDLYNEAKKVYDQTLPSTHEDIKRILVNKAETYYCEGQFNKAMDINLKAKDTGQLESLVEASRLCNMSEVYREKGLYLLAMSYSLRGLHVRRKILGETTNHVDIATALRNVGQIYLARGDFVAAKSWLNDSKEMLKKALHSNRFESSPTLAVVYNCLAQVALRQRHTDDAVQLSTHACNIFKHTKMITVNEYVQSLLTCAEAHNQRKAYDEAQTLAIQALGILENHLPLHPIRAEVLYCLACVAEQQKNFLKAYQYIENALEHLQNIESDYARVFYKCTHKNAYLHYQQKDYSVAYETLVLWKKPIRSVSQ